MSEVVGILLAAGSSRRFGSDKRLHPLADGRPMALVSAQHMAAVCARTIVVIRPDDTALARLLAAEGLETIICNAAEQGMGHSLSSGVTASVDAAGWLIGLADMPYIQPASYQIVVHALQDGARIARPLFAGQMGHPVGFGADCLAELRALTGDHGGKAIIEAHRGHLVACPVDDAGVLCDVDRPSQIRLSSTPPNPLSS